MGRNLQLFKKARERIEAKFATEGGAPCDRRGASVASVAMSHRGGSFLEEASDNSLKNKFFNDVNDDHSPSNLMDERAPQKTENAARPSDKSDKSDKSPFSQHFAALVAGPPKGVLNQRWACAVADAEGFLGAWSDQADAMGWSAEDLFALDPVAPMARYDTMGLIWSLQGCPVVALTNTAATIRMPTGNHLRFLRRAEARNQQQEHTR